MAAGDSVRTIRTPGRVVINPTTSFETTAYPYGGTELGKAKMCVAIPIGRPYPVFCEGLGEFSDVLEPAKTWTISIFFRGADDDVIENLLAGGYAAGSVSQHARYAEPGARVPGQSMLVPGGALAARSVSVLYVPDNTVHAEALIAYRALPNLQDSVELKFQRGEEFGVPIAFNCLRDANGDMLQIGRIQDLTVPS